MERSFTGLTCLGGLLAVGALLSGCPAGGSQKASPSEKKTEPVLAQPINTTEFAEKTTEPAKTTKPGASPPPATPDKREPEMTETPRRNTGPGISEGVLSADFPEIEANVSASFAHDAGMMSRVESITVGGEACAKADVLKEMVARRKGWSREGGSNDRDVVETMSAYVEAWASALEYSGRLTSDEAPSNLVSVLYKPTALPNGPKVKPEPYDGLPDYHPPRVALYKLDNGEQIVVSSAFYERDGGRHGTQWDYEVEAYRVSDGSHFKLAPAPRRGAPLPGTPPAPVGPQPIDPEIPRSCHFSRSRR
ncbi:MAG: hypothetical protein JKY65_13255 [Planctomycetes bacterium]|nr:hypothetical protein [Planctomycetota bacterium]